MSGPGVATGLVLVGLLVAIGLTARMWAHATTADFYLAGRSVGVITNAFAICGDYFSAASFLGVAAAVYAFGLDGVWYATGFAAGFIPVLLFVAAPLRRFGDYSIPDFLGKRFDDERVRVVAVVIVELIILAYLVPQIVGAGMTWQVLVGHGIGGLSPYATGVIASATLTGGLVALGGMRGTTWTQAVQFCFLLATLLWLTVAALDHGFTYPAAVADASAEPLVEVTHEDGGAHLGVVRDQLTGGAATFGSPGARYGAVGAFALLVTLVAGTTGLPHVMNRFFTSPSGRAARMTTVWVLGLAGGFYALAVLLGTAARVVIPGAVADRPWLSELTLDGVLEVPEHALLVLGRLWGGTSGLGVVAAGALVAIISTIGGLLLAAAASFGHDLYERHVNRSASQRQALLAAQAAVVVATLAAVGLAFVFRPERVAESVPSVVATMVTWAFALAGSSLTPVLLMAIWWPRATARGMLAAMVTGAVLVPVAIVVGFARGAPDSGLTSLLMAPTIVAAPVAIAVGVVLSRRDSPPVDIDATWTRLHGTAADRRTERLARLTSRTAR
ncbi:MAG: cation acetate symporter [Actinomycetota bacterium]|nr:cation acetate symporter [Actinomycetota bacterium]